MVRRKLPKAQEELVRKSFDDDPKVREIKARLGGKITDVWQEIPEQIADPPELDSPQQAFPDEPPLPPPAPPGELAGPSDADYQMFEAIGVNRESVELAGIRRIEDHQAKDLGIHLPRDAAGSLDGWAIPYYIYADGERKRVGWVLRRDAGKPKYLCSIDKRHAYVPPSYSQADLEDVSRPIVFVESEKAALALAALFSRLTDNVSRLPIPIAVRGCTGWHTTITEVAPDGSREKKPGGVLAEIDRYVLPGRAVAILFDANWRTNSQVRREQKNFAKYLRSLAAKAFVCYLPAGDWNGPDDFLAKCGSEELFKVLQGKRENAPPGDMPLQAQFTACVNADRIVTDHGDRLRFCFELNSWLWWDGMRWKPDAQQRARQLTEQTLRNLLLQKSLKGTADEIVGAAKLLQTAGVSNALFETEKKLLINIEQLDSDPWLVTFANGTVDLRSGELGEPDQADYISKLIHFPFNPDASCPKWLSFLRHAVGDEGVRYLQKAFGYALTADTSEKKFWVLHGESNTGKTTCLTILAILLREFHSLLMVDTLLDKKGGDSAAQEDLASLRGCRFASTSELDRNRRLSIAQLKRICQGMGQISVSPKYQKKFSFPETHHLFIDSNYLPMIPVEETAIWNRLVVVRFQNSLPEAEQNRTLKQEIVAEEAEGILAWLVAGELRRQKEGLDHVPESFANAKSAWQSEMDSIGSFIEEYCVLGRNEKAPRLALYKLYVETVGHGAVIAREFTRQLELRDITRSNDRRLYVGIALKTGADNSAHVSAHIPDDDSEPVEPDNLFD
jgi:P4 family phage/plasmid primase-like protien